MKNKIKEMLDMLIFELENLLEDIRAIEDLQSTKEKNREISKYVYLENTSLLKKELSSIQWLIARLSEDECEEVADISSFSDKVNDYLEHHQSHANMPGAVHSLVNNKLEKIVKYFSDPDNLID